MVLVTGTLAAQNIRVTGKVTDNTGLPIPGVTVLIEGTRTGVATGADGTFSIDGSAGRSASLFCHRHGKSKNSRKQQICH